jgi:hypothetical protein
VPVTTQLVVLGPDVINALDKPDVVTITGVLRKAVVKVTVAVPTNALQ